MKVYFTVDVETSMGGAWANPDLRPLPCERRIFCPAGGKMMGIPRICELLERYGFRGTFFVETLAAEVNGDADCRPAFELLLERGHDVQLHAHPNFHFYAQYRRSLNGEGGFERGGMSDLFSRLSAGVQAEVLGRATENFVRLAGRRPTCFRAGGFGANRETLRVLAGLGVYVGQQLQPVLPERAFVSWRGLAGEPCGAAGRDMGGACDGGAVAIAGGG